MDLIQHGEIEHRSVVWADLVSILTKRKMVIVFVFLTTVLSAYGILQFFLTERYEATAKVLVELGRENTEVPATVQKGSVSSFGVRKEELTSEMLMLSSPNLVEAVVDKIGLEAFMSEPPRPQTILQAMKYCIKKGLRWSKEQFHSFLIAVGLEKELTEREKIILGIEGGLKVETEKDSDVLSMNLLWPDPDLAVRVLNTLLQLYLDYHIQVRGNIDLKGFFDSQAESHKQQLQDIELAKEEIKAKWNLISVAEQRTLLLQQLHQLNNQIGANETEKATLQARKASMHARLKVLSDELRQSQVVNPNPSLQSIKERLTSLQQERAKLSTVYDPESPKIRNIDKEISALKGMRAEEIQTVVGSVTLQANPLKQNFMQSIEEIEVQIAGLEANSQELRSQATTAEEQLERINMGEYELAAVERERQMAEQKYLTYVQRREEARILREFDLNRIANISILSPPMKPIQPVYPRKLLIMALSIPVGLLLSTTLALLLEYMNDIVTTRRDLAGIDGLSYLGTLCLQGSLPAVGFEAKANGVKAVTPFYADRGSV